MCVKCSNTAKTKPLGFKTWPKNGYVRVYVGKGKTKFEHVATMEQHLKRRLLEGEHIHHINGVKDDNHIENLELWIRPHPSGIRAKDALRWARKTIEKYGHLEHLLSDS